MCDVTASPESTIHLLHIFEHMKSFYHCKLSIGSCLQAVSNKTINIILSIPFLKLLLHKLSFQLSQVAEYFDVKLIYRYLCRTLS